ncbi:hypothetical protein SAMN02745146_0078 [Hymenobacter daecheongensis DSM 21074]|uniref:Uncharacterized protein n=1 Tax=Hymenobacter daecheongensis DSM 21074 TaxID=1121955 RepID=A0A1M6LW40_9BACT|nr:hypothetical protein [Hymenobacter daecheongensis]SHJ75437.1 hypothetical protein SAMN02745146_0078 [Hymenobacter daecheongensis DSM 21074]
MKPINPNQNKLLHLLLTQCELEHMKETLVSSFTDERSTSSTDLTEHEAGCLICYLQDEHNQKCKPMRGKVIHYLCLLGYVDDHGKADWARIDNFIVNIGSNNPRRVRLNFLYRSELPKVVSQVEAMYKHETKRLAK